MVFTEIHFPIHSHSIKSLKEKKTQKNITSDPFKININQKNFIFFCYDKNIIGNYLVFNSDNVSLNVKISLFQSFIIPVFHD